MDIIHRVFIIDIIACYNLVSVLTMILAYPRWHTALLLRCGTFPICKFIYFGNYTNPYSPAMVRMGAKIAKLITTIIVKWQTKIIIRSYIENSMSYMHFIILTPPQNRNYTSSYLNFDEQGFFSKYTPLLYNIDHSLNTRLNQI